MTKIFDRSDRCVGLVKPVPRQVTLIEPPLNTSPIAFQRVFTNPFHNVVVEVLDAFDVNTMRCTYRGLRGTEFRQLFQVCDSPDVIWDETNDIVEPLFCIVYILACESQDKVIHFSTKFQRVNFVSTVSEHYTCAVFRDPGPGAQPLVLRNTWERFQWMQARQVLESEKLTTWLSERNLKTPIEYAPQPEPARFASHLYAHKKRELYKPVSPIYRKAYRPVSPIYRSGVSWLNQHIQMTQ